MDSRLQIACPFIHRLARVVTIAVVLLFLSLAILAGRALGAGAVEPDSGSVSHDGKTEKLAGKKTESVAKTEARAGYFFPKFFPMNWYKTADLKTIGGILPDREHFRIKSKSGAAVEIDISDSDNNAASAYVSLTKGYLTDGLHVLRFTALMSETERPPLRFWLDKDSATSFLQDEFKTSTLNDLEELIPDEKVDWPEKLPLLEVSELNVDVGAGNVKKVPIYKTILRLPPLSASFWNKLSGLEDQHRVLFLVDSSGSMLPIGRDTLSGLVERMKVEGRIWGTNKIYGSIFFRERGERVEVRASPFRSLFELRQTLAKRFDDFQGGAEEPEPTLDAIHFAIDKLPWERDLLNKKSGQRVIVLFTSGDLYPKPRSNPPFSSPNELTPKLLGKNLARNNIRLIFVQASPEPGENLMLYMDQLEKQASDFIRVVRYQRDMPKQISAAMSGVFGASDKDAIAIKQAIEFSERARAIGGAPVFPTRFQFSAVADKISATSAAATDAGEDWIAVEAWTVDNANLMRSEPID
ncbi:MAG: VWA domain-containing protein [Alphaproteobacteria bacterium]|nr:VWA domain-containing protein [Alphaproteobacteria bacterium]